MSNTLDRAALRDGSLETLGIGVVLIILGVANLVYGLATSSITALRWAASGAFLAAGLSLLARYAEEAVRTDMKMKTRMRYVRIGLAGISSVFVVLFVYLRVSQ